MDPLAVVAWQVLHVFKLNRLAALTEPVGMHTSPVVADAMLLALSTLSLSLSARLPALA
jgi:hypothetical protein